MPQNPSIICGLVVDSRGQPVVGARVFFIAGPVSLPDIAALTDNHGGFRLSAPAPGDYTLQCIADGFFPTTVRTTVKSKESIQLTVELSRQD
jgi:hypothetical protein